MISASKPKLCADCEVQIARFIAGGSNSLYSHVRYFFVFCDFFFWVFAIFSDLLHTASPEPICGQNLLSLFDAPSALAVRTGVWQCIVVCCSVLHCHVLQCVAVRCSTLKRARTFGTRSDVAVFCSVLQRAAACCSVPQRVAVCCSVLQCVALPQHVAVCCSVLRCACFSSTILNAIREIDCVEDIVHLYEIKNRSGCSVLQCVAVCCSVLQCVENIVHLYEIKNRSGCSVLQCVAVCCSV